jgi:hypothetical protein
LLLIQQHLLVGCLNTVNALYDKTFQEHLAAKIGPNNRMVFMDAQYKKTVFINKQLGIEYRDLWLSNTKWFDSASFGLSNQTDFERLPS